MPYTIHKLTRHAGMAGQFSVSAVVSYDAEPAADLTFVGSTYGGPVLMQTPGTPAGVFVTDSGRFGDFGEEWVRRFFGVQ